MGAGATVLTHPSTRGQKLPITYFISSFSMPMLRGIRPVIAPSDQSCDSPSPSYRKISIADKIRYHAFFLPRIEHLQVAYGLAQKGPAWNGRLKPHVPLQVHDQGLALRAKDVRAWCPAYGNPAGNPWVGLHLHLYPHGSGCSGSLHCGISAITWRFRY